VPSIDGNLLQKGSRREPGFETIRNWRGEVLRRNAATVLFIRRGNTCAMEWRRFGYDHLGGGKYGSDVTWQTVSDSTPLRYDIGDATHGKLTMTAGVARPVDCARLK